MGRVEMLMSLKVVLLLVPLVLLLVALSVVRLVVGVSFFFLLSLLPNRSSYGLP